MSFTVALPIRFAHCDPAGIAYFPRLFELVDAAIEDWTAAALGVTRAAMHGELRLGLPTVDLNADFLKPCRLGETLEIGVTATGAGGSWVDLAARASADGTDRFGVRLRQVLMNLDTARATPWPPEWRTRLPA